MKRFLAMGVVLFVCAALSTHIFGQTTNATLGGTVSDATGALIPGVTVTATNNGTGIVNSVLTNESGAYQHASLQPGTYKVTAELPGFQTQVANNVSLGLGQQARLNFTLQVSTVSQTVEVSIAAEAAIATTSSSVGTVLPESKITDLPLGSRNIQALISTTAGTGPQGDDGGIYGNFAGGRISSVNVTRDGFVTTDGRYTHGEFSQTYTSPDLVEEVRVITATVDAENGRGSGQVQMVTRSGTNDFRGSAVWTNRNSALDANSWFNNFNRVKPDWENRNQFAFRLGGPIKKNKTFFFFLVEEQRDVLKQNVVGTVLTPTARQGIFRYFPGVDNQNTTGAKPTVDVNGVPVLNGVPTTPSQFSIFGKDPLRPGYDPTGFVKSTLVDIMPMPNDYTVGDGLNTAGYRWTRRIYGTDVADGNSNDQNNRDQVNVRLDHNFNSNNKLSYVMTIERSIDHSSQAGLRSVPNGFDGAHSKWPRIYTVSFVSTLSSNMVNEARVGLRRSAIASQAPFWAGRNLDGTGSPTGDGVEANKLLPRNNGIPFQLSTSFIGSNAFMNWSAGFGSTRSSQSPLWQYADTLSWTIGKHALKAGGEFRRDRTNGWNDNNMTPQAVFGAPASLSVTGIDTTAAPGASANTLTNARNMLTDLAGSIASIREGFDLATPTSPAFQGFKDGYVMHDRDWRSNEFSGFIKDDWKFSSALTFNIGLHWEYFGIPFEGKGRAAQPTAGNEKGACGISCGALTVSQFVGKNSPHPDLKLYNDDYNNFAPSIGLAYTLPWLGKDKTILRMGYGWAYTGGALKSANGILDSIAGSSPGAVELNGGNGITFNPTTYTNMANISLPIPQQFGVLSPPPIDGQRTDNMSVYATDRVTPYVQNFNFEVQRQVTNSLTVNAAYVGSKATKLIGAINTNIVNINSVAGGQTMLQAFNITRAGGDAPYFTALLNGINIGGGATAVNGTTETGSSALRKNTTTRAFIANGNIGALANYLNTNASTTGKGGGLYTTNGFPQNFFVSNPQFASVTYYNNPAASTYHSLQLTATQRLSHGVQTQSTYTWSKTIDLSDGDGTVAYRDPNNINLEKARAGYDRTHSFTSNATYELPFGPNHALLANATGWVQRLTEQWQLGGVLGYTSGAPLTITAPISSIWQTTSASTPMAVGAFPAKGKVTYVSNGITFLSGYTQAPDPAKAGVSTANSLDTSYSNLAIFDANNNPVLVNPGPGQVGSLGRNTLEGPAAFNFDANLIKRVKMSETKLLEFRLDVVNILNHPNFANPSLNINTSGTFGRITAVNGSARRFTVNARLNF